MQTVRKHPRTLQEAFGPYCDHHIYEKHAPVLGHEWAMVALGLAFLVGVLVGVV